MSELYNIYCDESCHLANDKEKAMTLGAIWCPFNKKDAIFECLREIKAKHGLSSKFELKWNKVSMSKYDYYEAVLNYFFDNSDLHFRVLVVPDKSVLNHDIYSQTHNKFYYKMYFDMLKTIFAPNFSYNIYIDIKDTIGAKRVEKLHEVLCNSQYDFSRDIIRRVQQVRSDEVELIALADFFTGAISYLYRGLNTSEAKLKLIQKIKEKSGYSLERSTLYKEDKFNLFVWRSGYGK
jgi:hypothetical protein